MTSIEDKTNRIGFGSTIGDVQFDSYSNIFVVYWTIGGTTYHAELKGYA